MYIIAVLCMIKIYQTRHPDINARAPVTFGILALIIFIGLIGVLNGSMSFWVIFTILHLLTCLVLTVQIYYMGRCKFNRGVFKRVIQVRVLFLLLRIITISFVVNSIILNRHSNMTRAVAYGIYCGHFTPHDS